MAVGNREFCLLVKDFIALTNDIELVGVANNGLEALELVEQKQPDVLVLDYVMPHLDGLGVLTKLQNITSYKKPKVIVISASVTDHFMLNANKLGTDYQISRTIDIEEVLKFVRMAMGNTNK